MIKFLILPVVLAVSLSSNADNHKGDSVVTNLQPKAKAHQRELDHKYFLHMAYEQALKSYNEGGCPIGSVIVDENGKILGKGHNMLVQEGNPVLHGEMSAMRDAGRMPSRRKTTLYTTLSPCMMCTGTIIQFKIGRVVIGDTINSGPANVELLKQKGVEVIALDDPDSIALVKKFRKEKPDLWLEDWGGS
ncbi:MAG: nucleoside deaminase [Gammaproteobacteria bacterium]|nr:nucleoside deaminase [Gammaproteobacteria bacterium]